MFSQTPTTSPIAGPVDNRRVCFPPDGKLDYVEKFLQIGSNGGVFYIPEGKDKPIYLKDYQYSQLYDSDTQNTGYGTIPHATNRIPLALVQRYASRDGASGSTLAALNPAGVAEGARPRRRRSRAATTLPSQARTRRRSSGNSLTTPGAPPSLVATPAPAIQTLPAAPWPQQAQPQQLMQPSYDLHAYPPELVQQMVLYNLTPDELDRLMRAGLVTIEKDTLRLVWTAQTPPTQQVTSLPSFALSPMASTMLPSYTAGVANNPPPPAPVIPTTPRTYSPFEDFLNWKVGDDQQLENQFGRGNLYPSP
jgi:hypothetical protein